MVRSSALRGLIAKAVLAIMAITLFAPTFSIAIPDVSAATQVANGDSDLEGRKKDNSWTDGNVCSGPGACYAEGENVRHRVRLDDLTIGTEYYFRVDIEHICTGAIIGYANINSPTISSGSVGITGPTTVGNYRRYTFTFVATDDNPTVEFNALVGNDAAQCGNGNLDVSMATGNETVTLPINEIVEVNPTPTPSPTATPTPTPTPTPSPTPAPTPSPTAEPEPTPTPTPTPSPEPICGDNLVEGGEQCDDGNVNNGDGCSMTCQTEPSPTPTPEVTPTPIVEPSSEPSPTAEATPIPSPTAEPEPTPTPTPTPSPEPICGDSMTDANEQCDDGNVNNGDGCSMTCQTEPSPTPTPEATPTPSVEPICGNEQTEGNEQCDDGGTQDGDGCSANCTLEATPTPSPTAEPEPTPTPTPSPSPTEEPVGGPEFPTPTPTPSPTAEPEPTPTPTPSPSPTTTPDDEEEGGRPDLVARKVAVSAAAGYDEAAVFDLYWKNIGSMDETGGILKEFIPDGTVFNAPLSDSGWTCSNPNASGTPCMIAVGDIPADGQWYGPVRFAVTVKESKLHPWMTDIENGMWVMGENQFGPNQECTNPDDLQESCTNNDSHATVPLKVDLDITKTDGKTVIAPGATNTYTIVATNNGPSAINPAWIVDSLPSQYDLGSVLLSCPGCDNATLVGSQILATAQLDSGESVTLTVTAKVKDDASGTISNIAIVTSEKDHLESDTGNNAYLDTTAIEVIDIAVTKTDGKTTIEAGATNTYTITVTNKGPQTANPAYIIDNIPLEYDFSTVTATCPACSFVSGNGTGVVYAEAVLAAGQSAVLTITATLKPNTGGTMINTVIAGSPLDKDDTNKNDNAYDDATFITDSGSTGSGSTGSGSTGSGSTGSGSTGSGSTGSGSSGGGSGGGGGTTGDGGSGGGGGGGGGGIGGPLFPTPTPTATASGSSIPAAGIGGPDFPTPTPAAGIGGPDFPKLTDTGSDHTLEILFAFALLVSIATLRLSRGKSE